MTTDQVLRRVRFRPYAAGMGPTFALTTWDTYRRDGMGKSLLGYRLTMREPLKAPVVVFEGEDFATPGCVDNDAAVAGIMGFLTLRPGDTDAEYFASYTPVQLDYCSSYAETLSGEVAARFQCAECGSESDLVTRTVDGYKQRLCCRHADVVREGRR